jgi:hypothetical protein
LPHCRIAVGPQAGRKVFTLQTLPACDESFSDQVGKAAGSSLHAGVAARVDEVQDPSPTEWRASMTLDRVGGRLWAQGL